MSSTQQRPEGRAIDRARKTANLSVRKAAAKAGISEGRWRQIVNGYQSAGAGQVVTVHGPAETIARMATAVGVTASQLREAGRDDAAAALSEPFSTDEAASAVEHVRAQLNPALARFTDHELVTELQVRLLLMASRLHAAGDPSLVFVTDADGSHVVTSRPVGDA